jgi:hypothetical protein
MNCYNETGSGNVKLNLGGRRALDITWIINTQSVERQWIAVANSNLETSLSFINLCPSGAIHIVAYCALNLYGVARNIVSLCMIRRSTMTFYNI